MKRKFIYVVAFSFILLLSGCAYKGDEDARGDKVYPEQIESVQRAIDTYQEQSGGLLPIKTKESDTDIYIKYPIEFTKLVPEYMEKIPSNAFEKGGVFQYVLTDVEENPTVKLVDIRFAERIRDLNVRKNANNGSIPFKDPVGEAVYEVDYKAMGFKEQVTVRSPYSNAHLPLVVGGDGKFYIDYSIDLQKMLNEKKPSVEQGEDIRFLLEDHSVILPAYSLPYTVNDKNEPVFMKK